MKKLIVVVAIILVAVLVLFFAKDMIAKSAVENGVKLVTGLRLSMGSFNFGILKPFVGIKDLTLFNPQGYVDKIMLTMPQIYVDYDLLAIIKGKVHLKELKIDLKELIVVKNKNGELNLNSLNVVKQQKEGQQQKGKMPEIQIDSLELKIGKVIYKDYTAGPEPSVREFNIDLNEKYANINDPYALASLILVKALMNTTIASLANFDLTGLQDAASNAIASAEKIVSGVTTRAQEAAKGVIGTVGKAAQGLKDIITLPFGGKEEQK